MNTKSIGTTLLTIGIAAAIALFALNGCQVGDVVQANIPQSVRKVVPSEPRVSYNEAKIVYADWRVSVERTGEQFQQELDSKAELVSLFSLITNDAISSGIPVLEQLPGGGLLTSGLIGLGAWFLRSPGTTRLISKEKERSFNKGLSEGKGIFPHNQAAPPEPSPRRAAAA